MEVSAQCSELVSLPGLIEMFGPGVRNVGVLRRARMFGRVTALCDFPSRCRREVVGGQGQCGLVPTGPSAPEPPPPRHRAAFPGYPVVCSVRLAGTPVSGFPVRVWALRCEHGLGTPCCRIPFAGPFSGKGPSSGLFLLSALLAQAHCFRMLLRALSSVSATVTGTGG